MQHPLDNQIRCETHSQCRTHISVHLLLVRIKTSYYHSSTLVSNTASPQLKHFQTLHIYQRVIRKGKNYVRNSQNFQHSFETRMEVLNHARTFPLICRLPKKHKSPSVPRTLIVHWNLSIEVPEPYIFKMTQTYITRWYLFRNNACIGMGLPALGGEPGERVRIKTTGERNSRYHRNAEQRQPPCWYESYHQPRQEGRQIVDGVSHLPKSNTTVHVTTKPECSLKCTIQFFEN